MGNVSSGVSIFRPLFGDIRGCGDYYTTGDSLSPEEEDHFAVKGHPWTACGPCEEGGFVKLSWRLGGEVLLEERIYQPRDTELFIRTSCKDRDFIRDDVQVETDYEVDARQLTIDFLRP